VKVLLNDPRVEPQAENPWLNQAVHKNAPEIVKILLNDPRVDPTARKNFVFKESVRLRLDDVFPILLEDPRIDPTLDDNFALEESIRNGFLVGVDLLLKDPRVHFDNSFFQKACRTNHYDVQKLLLADPRCEPEADNDAALKCAGQHGQREIVLLLLRNPRIGQNTALIFACQYGQTGIVRLLSKKPRIDLNTALIFACQHGQTEIVRLLLKNPRIDPNVDNNLPLNAAVGSRCRDLIELLLDDPRIEPDIDEDSLFWEDFREQREGTEEIIVLFERHPRVSGNVKKGIRVNRDESFCSRI